MVDPERNGKRRFDLPLALAATLLVLAIAFAPIIPFR
jgi:hypothetical protein